MAHGLHLSDVRAARVLGGASATIKKNIVRARSEGEAHAGLYAGSLRRLYIQMLHGDGVAQAVRHIREVSKMRRRAGATTA